jgi:hypothetical protein
MIVIMIQEEVIGINAGLSVDLPSVFYITSCVCSGVSMESGQYDYIYDIRKTGSGVLMQIGISEHYEISPRILQVCQSWEHPVLT